MPFTRTQFRMTYATYLVTSLCLVLLYIPLPLELLYFDRAAYLQGEIWRVLSGHFVHADRPHLFWNMAGLLVLGYIIEQRSRTLLWASFLAGIISVTLFLFSPFSSISIYCGLSGVLNTLLVVALWLVWRESHSKWIIATFWVCILKIAVEITANQSVISTISWPPSPESHLAGFLGGLILTVYLENMTRKKRKSTLSPTPTQWTVSVVDEK